MTFIPEATRGWGPSRVRAAAFIVRAGKRFGKRYETGTCEVARETARRLGLPETVQRALYEAHEQWRGGGAPKGSKARRSRCRPGSPASASKRRAGTISGGRNWPPPRSAPGGGHPRPIVVDVFIKNDAAILAEASAGDPRERILEVEPEPVVEKDRPSCPR